jgi:hypothetical protein
MFGVAPATREEQSDDADTYQSHPEQHDPAHRDAGPGKAGSRRCDGRGVVAAGGVLISVGVGVGVVAVPTSVKSSAVPLRK